MWLHGDSDRDGSDVSVAGSVDDVEDMDILDSL